MEQRQDIQVLRGVAILAIVLFHLQVPYFDNGLLGVDIFFVISGFLMAKLYDRDTALAFYKRRIDRLLPAYGFSLLATLLISCFVILPVDFSQLFEQTLAGILFISNIHFWDQSSYFDRISFRPLLHLWSLSVEAQFCLLVPLIFPLLQKKSKLVIFLIIALFASCAFIQIVSPKTSFFLTPFRIWEFLIGAWVAWNSSKLVSNEKLLIAFKWSTLPLIIIIIAAPLEPQSGSLIFGQPSFIALLVCILTAISLNFGITHKIEKSTLGSVLSKIGDYSYSIYLIHFPLIVLWNYKGFGGTWKNISGLKNYFLIVLILAICSYLMFNYIEKLNTRYLIARFPRFALMLFIPIVAFSTLYLNSAKYSAVEKNIFAAWTDRGEYRCGRLFRMLNPLQHICQVGTFGDGNRVLLIGNSHADSIKTEFSKIANKSGLSVYFYVSSDPLYGDRVMSEDIMDDLKRFAIGSIVLHFNNRFSDKNFVEELNQLINFSLINNIKVFLISPVPTYGVHVPQMMYKDVKNNTRGSFGINRAVHLKKTSNYLSFINTLDKKRITIFDPSEYLCPNFSTCEFSDRSSRPYYFDSSHLTLTGSTILKPIFRKIIHIATEN